MTSIVLVALVVLAAFAAGALIVIAMIAHCLDKLRRSTRSTLAAVGSGLLAVQFSIGVPLGLDSFTGMVSVIMLVISLMSTITFAVIAFADYQRERATSGTQTQPLDLRHLASVK